MSRHFFNWLSILLCLVLGGLIGTAVFTFVYAKGGSYLSNNPQTCVNCHIMNDEYDSWVKSSHHKAATCNDCHIPHAFPLKYLVKMKNGWNHSRAFTAQDFPEPIRITKSNLTVLENNCLHCHRDMAGSISAEHGGRGDAHRCTECHRSAGHMSLS